ncbi:MAG: N-acetyltransferase family protein [Acidobacteriota bacterium]|nr:N-acetyltransferase family protein [Acidobacteriota bacterium]
MNIRKARLADAEQMAQIYNFYIENSHHTFETEAISTAEMKKRIDETLKNYPFFVAEDDGGKIAAYAFANQYKSRCAYRNSAEVSVYVKNGQGRRGTGAKLYEKLFAELLQTDVHALIAGIALPNEASIKLHERFGFEKVAHFREVGFKFERWIDVGYWELINCK